MCRLKSKSDLMLLRWLLSWPVVLLVFGCDMQSTAEPQSDKPSSIAQQPSPGYVRVGDLLGELDQGVGGGEDGFQRALSVREFVFPADHGPHDEYRSEWWYLTATLEDQLGNEFGLQFTVFRQALGAKRAVKDPIQKNKSQPINEWLTNQSYMAHLALTDVAAGSHQAYQRISRAHAGLAGARAAPFAVWLDDWRLFSDESVAAGLRLQAKTADFEISLLLTSTKPIVLQGNQGLSAKGENQASYYYSIPHLAATGDLFRKKAATGVRDSDKPTQLNGLAWLDREWSTSVLSAAHVGWDWFALHLEDGVDLMAFRLRRADGQRDPFDQAKLIFADGQALSLAPEEFLLTPVDCWPDGASCWPTQWRLEIEHDQFPNTLHIDTPVADQKMSTLVTYWEGLIHVHEDRGAERVKIGTGYMELTGY